MESDIVSGQQSAWVLLKRLGEGDAGEVYLVESLLEKQIAILKRPGRSAFASDVIRQTAQINNEGKILKALSSALDLEPGFGVRVPRLIDQSKPGTAYSERLFIVIEKAPGFDLSALAKSSRLGNLSGIDMTAETPEAKRFLQTISEGGARQSFSNRILLSVLNNLLETFDHIHNLPLDLDGVQANGVMWNDVKPEHLYWDPLRARLTIIDWGNGQFLEKDGATKDRRYTSLEDFRQFLEAFGRFLELFAPTLLSRLDWPREGSTPDLILNHENILEIIPALRDRVRASLQKEVEGLTEARRREMELLRSGSDVRSSSARNPLLELEDLHRQIIFYGEYPDFAGGLYFALNCAKNFAEHELLEEVQEVSAWSAGLPGSNIESLKLTAFLAQLASRSADSTQRQALCQAVQATLGQDWGSVLWNLSLVLHGLQEPDWWYELIEAVRLQALGEDAGDARPFLIARRALLTLQAMLEKMQDHLPTADESVLNRLQILVRRMRDEMIPAWMHSDPAPPYSNLAYQDVEEDLDEIGAFLPEARYNLDRALDAPRAMIRQVMQNWEQGDFLAASQGLRLVLLTDPDRKRVISADHALQAAPRWLEKVHHGPESGEHYRHFVTEIEFEGRQLRNHIGGAGWLDLILEGCRQLRKGTWPPELFTSLPLLLVEMPWLSQFERRERLPLDKLPASIQLPPLPPAISPLLGVAKGKLGLDGDLHLTAPLDAWIPEARGSSARVFNGFLRLIGTQQPVQGETYPAAIKLMRMDKVEYSLPLFREEVLVLNVMGDVPGVTPLMECGFIQIEDGSRLPTEREATIDKPLSGSVVRIGPKSFHEFVYQIDNRIKESWIPYLALELRDPKTNLLSLCDASFTGGIFRPVSDLLLISIQICDILIEAHLRNVVYRDHKILHYYWLEETRGVSMIDWNVARLYPDGLSDYEKQMDIVQFGARALHHILTGRTAPGALPLGPTRPEDIEQAAKTYQVQWTYDDQRLPEELRGILERTLSGEYLDACALRDDLKQAFLRLSE